MKEDMPPSLTIGDFARATHLSIKALRFYHKEGLLEPAEIDPRTGYRRYLTEQIPIAQVIRRLRSLDMSLDDIRVVLAANDFQSRNAVLSRHLRRLEKSIIHLQDTAASLRELLEPPLSSAPIEHRSVLSVTAAAISEVVAIENALVWYHGALGELHAVLSSQNIAASGPSGGIFSDDFFSLERGQATVYIPCESAGRVVGRVNQIVIPAAELAITLHKGSHSEIDRAYGRLATHVTRNALAVDGPIREFYLIGPQQTKDENAWRTEIGWPIFRTA